MKEFEDKVAVITGAASGIGRGIAERCAQEGMKVVLADIEQQALAQTEADLQSIGASVLAVRTDVSKVGEIEALAKKTLETYGGVHMLFNNAGVGAGSTVWESTLADWQWVIGVNLWGVIHGIRVFVPIMLEQDTECYIVNTASIAGVLPYHPNSTYQVTKHAVVALSEHLYYSLKQRKSNINTSVLCPGWVKTKILDCARNRPAELLNEVEAPLTPERMAVEQFFFQAVESGISPKEVADDVFKAIQEEQFYIFTTQEFNPSIQMRMESILQQRNLS
jgi:NAD(P)-dependent dehydrogenase (short-subunit alcohol dehydrogenase family)